MDAATKRVRRRDEILTEVREAVRRADKALRDEGFPETRSALLLALGPNLAGLWKRADTLDLATPTEKTKGGEQ